MTALLNNTQFHFPKHWILNIKKNYEKYLIQKVVAVVFFFKIVIIQAVNKRTEVLSTNNNNNNTSLANISLHDQRWSEVDKTQRLLEFCRWRNVAKWKKKNRQNEMRSRTLIIRSADDATAHTRQRRRLRKLKSARRGSHYWATS